MSNDNIYTIDGGKSIDSTKFPENEYVIVNKQGEEFYSTGFLLFTSHHVAVMRESEGAPIPVLIVPLGDVKVAQLASDVFPDEDDTELPF